MDFPDLINSLFEFTAGCLIWLNVRALKEEKIIKGVRILPTTIFFFWGIWNLYYYPHLTQWASLVGGTSIVAANLAWLFLAFRYGLYGK